MNKGQSHNCEPNGLTINNLGQFVLIDWLEFTIHYDFSTMLLTYDEERKKSYTTMTDIADRIYQLFEYIFSIDRFEVEYEQRGRNGYTGLYFYKNIQAWITTDVSMGIHFEISGQGCREIEKLNLNWFDLLSKIKNYKYKITRIDLSLDDFTNDYYTLSKIKRYLSSNRIVTKLRTYYNVNSGIVDNNQLLGETLQLGSKSSLVHITFYNKLKERESNNYVIDENIKYWTRTEIRFRNEKAIDVVNHLVEKRELNTIIKGVLNDYVRFVYKSEKDKNKWRWQTADWWLKFIDNVDKLELAPVKVYTSIETKKEWLKENVSKTELMVLFSEIENISMDDFSLEFVTRMLKGAIDKIKPKDLTLINEHRLAKDLELLTMDDFNNSVRSIKDVIVIKNKQTK